MKLTFRNRSKVFALCLLNCVGGIWIGYSFKCFGQKNSVDNMLDIEKRAWKSLIPYEEDIIRISDGKKVPIVDDLLIEKVFLITRASLIIFKLDQDPLGRSKPLDFSEK